MKFSLYLGTLFGIGLAVALIATNDAGVVFEVFAQVGLGLIPVICVRAAIILVCSGAWAMLHTDLTAISPGVWPLIRSIREGINVLLPVATIGGEIAGARLLTFWGVPASVSGAGILVDLLLQAAGQAIFALIGVLLLTRIAGTETLTRWVLVGIGVGFLALTGFFVALRFDGVGRIGRFVASRVAQWSRDGSARFLVNPARLAEALAAIWRRPRDVGVSAALHVLAWLLGTLEIWIALHWMGHHTSLADAMVLESLGQAVRGAAFPVPGGIGVQEGGFILLGQLLGIDPQTAIALSLVKRVPDIVLGLPALFAWHWLERRHKNALPPPLPGLRPLNETN